MPIEIFINETDATQRTIPVYLEQPSGAPQTSLTGITVVYQKPGGSDTPATLTSDGNGRYRLVLGSGDVDTNGIGWLTCSGASIITFVDSIKIKPLPPVSLGAGAITSTAIADGAITAAKIAANAIGNTQLADNAISASKLAAGAITAAKLASDALSAIASAVLGQVVYSTRTIKGILTRQDRALIGKWTGLKSSTATVFMPDGTTPVISVTQDTNAGTRETASTATGD